MLGKKSVPKLYNLQIKTIGELAKTDKKVLEKKFGKHGIMMWEYANGIDNSEVKKRTTKGNRKFYHIATKCNRYQKIRRNRISPNRASDLSTKKISIIN